MGVVVSLNHIFLGYLAWGGGKFAIVELVIFSILWVFFAVTNSRARNRNLESWIRSLDRESEVSKLAGDYAALLTETCGKLAAWDEDEAMEIMGRASTIGKLRQMNVNERSSND